MNKQLTDARIARGMTQVELAERAGLQQPALSRIETGVIRRAGLETQLRIAGVLGVPVKSVFPDSVFPDVIFPGA